MTEAAKEPTRPTGTNAEQNEKIAALEAKIEALLAAQAPKRVVAALPPEEAIAAVLAARGEPKTYRALMDGTDIKQGVVKAGEVFTTTQPQGSWMELVEEPKTKTKKSDD
jgi:hypothetical protein